LNFYGSAKGVYLSPDPHEKDENLECPIQKVKGKSECVENCIISYNLYHKAPGYSVYIHNCRDELEDMFEKCVKKCIQE